MTLNGHEYYYHHSHVYNMNMRDLVRDQDLTSHDTMHVSRVTEVLGHVCRRKRKGEGGRERERARRKTKLTSTCHILSDFADGTPWGSCGECTPVRLSGPLVVLRYKSIAHVCVCTLK